MTDPGTELQPTQTYVPERWERACELLNLRIAAISKEASLALPKSLAERLGAAARLYGGSHALRANGFGREAQDVFLVALSVGLPVDVCARLAGVNPRTPYTYRERDEVFKREWEDALETSTGAIETKLSDWVLGTDEPTVAHIRAAELLLRSRSRAHRRDRQDLGASVRVLDGPNGMRGIEVRTTGGGARIPD